MKFSSAYHPQTDGSTEVVNMCYEAYLRCLTRRKPKQRLKWLSCEECWYKTHYYSSHKTTPFDALYGREPLTLIKGSAHHSAKERS